MSQMLEQQLKASGVAQVIVVLKQTAATSAPELEKSLAGHFCLSERSLPGALAAAASLRAGGGRGAAPAPAKAMRLYPNLGVMLGIVDAQGLSALRKEKGKVAEVRSAPVFRLIRPKKKSAAAVLTKMGWGIKALGIDQLWKKGLSGKGILVGHLDTGVDGKHPAFAAHKDFPTKAIAHWMFFDDFGNESTSHLFPIDTDDHGTHTAATIAARPIKHGASWLRVGVAPGALLASAAVIEGGDAVARVLGGIDWAMSKRVRVLSMSLGFPGYVDDFEFITQALRQQDILPVFAVGNEGPGTSRSPGNYADALSVGAVDKNELVADFSSSQRFLRQADPIVPDIVAPGVDIVSAVPKKGFLTMSGTSMATPHIAGLAALLFEAKPGAKAAEVENAIFKSCKRPSGMQEERGKSLSEKA